MKSLSLKILSIAAAVAVIISFSIIPVSAGSNSYYDSGTVYISDFIKKDGFAMRDMYQLNAPYIDYGNHFEWTNTIVGKETGFPDLYTWSNYWLTIPTDTVKMQSGDVYYLDLYFVFKSSLPMWVKQFTIDFVSGDSDPTYKLTVNPQPTGSIDGWKSFVSLQKHSLHFQLEIKATGDCTFKNITFNFQLYKSRTDADYFEIFDTTTYRLYGGDPTSPNYPKYEDPKEGELSQGVDDYTEAESEVFGEIQGGLDQFGEMFTNFEISAYRDGLFAWVQIFDVIVVEENGDFLRQLIDLSLLIGGFAFLLGMATLSVRAFSGRRRGGSDSHSSDKD